MGILEHLETSPLSEWLSVSMAGFPTLIAVHSVGMAVVVGLSLMITLRLYGILTGFEARLIPRLLNLAAWGFVVNLVSGLLLFITRGPEYIGSYIFIAKMGLVLVSAAILFWLRANLKTFGPAKEVSVIDTRAKSMSLVATTMWFAAVVAGRLIAYLSDIYQ